MMKDILQEIIANKRLEIAAQKKAVSIHTLLALGNDRLERPVNSMRTALISGSGIIAEFKRKSPSKGWLHPNAKVQDIVPLYEKGGASACSILTDPVFFGGALNDLCTARNLCPHLPLLRKDFIIDEYQLYQARIIGADAILLIASCLTIENCRYLSELAQTLNMEVLLEIHSKEELEYINPSVDMLGVNNRNLGTFHTDVTNSYRLIQQIRSNTEKLDKNPILISESGISTPQDIIELKKNGFQGFLIGETFMKTNNPGDTLTSFIQKLP